MMATHSPYIVNYINLLLRRGQVGSATSDIKLSSSEIGVYQIIEGQAIPLSTETQNGVLVDARLMSEPISEIYREYNSL